MVPQAQRHIGVLRRITGRIGQWHGGKTNLAFARARHTFVGNAFMAQMGLGQLIHAMRLTPGIKRKAHHHRVVIGRDMHIVSGEHRHIIFQILSDFEDAWVAEQRP